MDHMKTPDGSFPDVIGHASLLHRLEHDIRQEQLGHAYILDGPRGSGKHTVARWLACAIACEHRPGQRIHDYDENQLSLFGAEDKDTVAQADGNAHMDTPLPCGVCPRCQKLLSGNCPDIHVISREGKATLGVDAIRPLKQNVLIPPGELDTSIYIIEDAETMTVQAQNALLLTLEEPPPYVLFLLLCDGAETLLDTIRSRAPVLRLKPVPDEDVHAYLLSHGHSLPKQDMAAVLLRAQGYIGQALELADPKTLAPIMKNHAMCDAFLEHCAAHQVDGVLTCLHQWGTKREAVCDVLAGLDMALRDLMLLRQDEHVPLCFYTDREAALDFSSRFTMRALLALHDAVCNAQNIIYANGNVRLTLIQMVLEAGIL